MKLFCTMDHKRQRELENEVMAMTREVVDTLKITLKYCPITKNGSYISRGSRKWAYILRLAHKYRVVHITAANRDEVCAVPLC